MRSVQSSEDSEAQGQGKGFVHGPKLIGVQTAGGAPEALRVYNGALLDEDSRLVAIKLNRRSERSRPSTGRGGRNERRAQGHELVSLNHHCVASALLLTPTGATRRR